LGTVVLSRAMSASDVDVVVVGGGLAGTATLRELARRGARAVLFEQNDLCSAGSRLAVGTIDATELLPTAATDRAAREERDREAELLASTARNLATFVPVLAITDATRRGASALARWDALLALRARAGGTTSATVLDASAVRALEPALSIDDDGGALLDRRLRLDAARLAIAFVRDAMEHGAEARSRCTVRSFSVKDGALAVRIDELGAQRSLSARALVLATGAWPEPGGAAPECTRTLQVVLDHAITTHAIVAGDESLVPFHGLSVASSRAAAIDGPTPTAVTRDEVRALLASLGRVVPELREARVVDTRACVRRLADRPAASPPVFRVARGTPWSARARAERVAGEIAEHLGLDRAIDTRSAKLPGGEDAIDAFELAERLAMPEASARRIALRHGARSIDIGARIGRRRTEAAVVCACEPVLEAEVRHAVRAELARDVSDVCRRTQLGLAACGGMRCAHRAAEIVASERALAPHEAREMARRFLDERWRARAPGLDATALAQEELARARWVGASGIDDADREPAE
jgi:glycerol-3-phosphate dehydrogenase